MFEESRKRSGVRWHGSWEEDFDWGRIREIESLNPVRRHFGKKAWHGYAVFEFSDSDRVVLECPKKGNPTFVLSSDWRNAIRLSKAEIREGYAGRYTRIVHTGEWLNRICQALSKPKNLSRN